MTTLKEYEERYQWLRKPYVEFTITVKTAKDLDKRELWMITDPIANALKIPADTVIEL